MHAIKSRPVIITRTRIHRITRIVDLLPTENYTTFMMDLSSLRVTLRKNNA